MKRNSPVLAVFCKLALLFALAGIVTSCVLIAGSGRNNTLILRMLFTIWELLPMFCLLMANFLSGSWSAITRFALYLLTISVSIISVIGYSGAFMPARGIQSFVFAAVPLLSWFLTVTVMLGAAALAERQGRLS